MLRRTATIHPVAKRRLVAIFVSRTRFAHSSHTVTRRRIRGTRTFFTVPSATRYYASFCHPRCFAKGTSLLSCILTAFASYWPRIKGRISVFEKLPVRTEITRTSNLIYLVKSTFGTSNLERVRNLNREIEETKQDTALAPI